MNHAAGVRRPRYDALGKMLRPLFAELAANRHRSGRQLEDDYSRRFHVSSSTVRAWKTGHAKPNTPNIIAGLARDAALVAKYDAVWCQDFLAACDSSPELSAELLRELFPHLPLSSAPFAPADSPAAPFLAPPLPAQAIVGRDRALHSLKRTVMASRATSLSAVRGLPGVGKTTLAVGLAHSPEVRARFADGVLWVGLGREPDVADGLRRWASALNMDLSQFERLPDQIARIEAIHDRIGQRRMLLAIDDAWHAEHALAFKLGGPNCAHLLTTRSLAIAHDFAADNITQLEELALADGARLFAAHAPRVARAERREVKRLVEMVGGLPLAIGLIARQAWKLAEQGEAAPARRLAQELSDVAARLNLSQPISPLERTPGLRHSPRVSLDAVIRLSFDVLTQPQQRAFAALSVLLPKPDSFVREAALATAACDAATLDTLIDAGLVEAVSGERLTLHQTVADFAVAQLGPASTAAYDEPTRRMIGFYAQFVEAHTRDYEALASEMPQLRHAMTLAKARRMKEFADIIGWLYRYYNTRAQFAEADEGYRDALTLSRELGDQANEAWSELHVGNIEWHLRGNYAEAARHMRRAADLHRAIGHIYRASDSLQALAAVREEMGQGMAAISTIEEAIEMGEELNDDSLVCHGLNLIGVVYGNAGDSERAIEYYERALVIARKAGHPATLGAILDNLGQRNRALGRTAQARAYAREALDIGRNHKILVRIVGSHLTLGGLAMAEGDLDEAERQFDHALRIAVEAGALRQQHDASLELARLRRAEKRFGEARRHVERAQGLADQLDSDECRGLALFELARLRHAEGDVSAALDLAQRSRALLAGVPSRRVADVDKWLARPAD